MENEHYAPPASVLESASPPKGPPPSQTTLAVRLLWLGLFLALPSVYYSAGRSRSTLESVVFVFFCLVMYVFTAYLNVSVRRGHNWARIVTLVFTTIGLLVVLFVPDPPEITAVERLINGIEPIIDVVATYLLFTAPSAAWFKSTRQS